MRLEPDRWRLDQHGSDFQQRFHQIGFRVESGKIPTKKVKVEQPNSNMFFNTLELVPPNRGGTSEKNTLYTNFVLNCNWKQINFSFFFYICIYFTTVVASRSEWHAGKHSENLHETGEASAGRCGAPEDVAA